MLELSDDALVVRGGLNGSESFENGSGVELDRDGNLQGVSVNAADGVSLAELTAPNPTSGYLGVPHTQVGVSTVGAIRASGGQVRASPTKRNRYHATLSELKPEQAAELFQPTILNPSRSTR